MAGARRLCGALGGFGMADTKANYSNELVAVKGFLAVAKGLYALWISCGYVDNFLCKYCGYNPFPRSLYPSLWYVTVIQ